MIVVREMEIEYSWRDVYQEAICGANAGERGH